MTILPDVLQPNLKLVFCGTAASRISAEVGAYYANPGNKFWRTLHQIGLTPRQFAPQEFIHVPEYGIGLTDVAKHTFGVDRDLRQEDFDVDALREKILKCSPHAVAFTSKRAAQEFYGEKLLRWGRQPDRIGESVIFVLPSPSGLASRSWDISYWHEAAAFVRSLDKGL